MHSGKTADRFSFKDEIKNHFREEYQTAWDTMVRLAHCKMNKRWDRVCKKIGWHLEEINIDNAADHIHIFTIR